MFIVFTLIIVAIFAWVIYETEQIADGIEINTATVRETPAKREYRPKGLL